MFRLFLSLFIFTLSAFPALAYTTNDSDQEKVKALFQNMLDYQKNVNEALGTVDVIYDGKLTVTPQEGYYEVTLPRIAMKTPEKIAEQSPPNTGVETFDLGVITVNIAPDENSPHLWKAALKLPSEMTLKGKDANNNLTVSFAEQTVIGILHEKLGYFSKFSATLSDMTFKTPKQGDLGVTLGGVQFLMNLNEEQTQDTKSVYSGPGYIAFSNVSITPPNNSADQLHLGQFKLDFTMEKAALPSLEEYETKILQHKETFDEIHNQALSGGSIKNMDGKALVDLFKDLYTFPMESVSFRYGLKDMLLESSKSKDKFDTFKLGQAHFGMGMSNLSSEAGSMSFTLGYQDAGFSPPSPDLKDILPQQFDMTLSADNLPYKTLSTTATNAVESISANPKTAQMVGMGLMMRLPAILSQAQTQINLKDTTLSSDVYTVDTHGTVQTDLSSITGFKARFDMLFKGLDALLSLTETRSQTAKPDNKNALTHLQDILTQMKSVGVKNDGGAYSYIFTTAPDGRMMVNDTDMSTLTSAPRAPAGQMAPSVPETTQQTPE